MILITGANGVVGRQVMKLLSQEGTAVSRGPGGARVVQGDLFRPEWIEPALEGWKQSRSARVPPVLVLRSC